MADKELFKWTDLWKFCLDNWENIIPVIFFASLGGVVNAINSIKKPSFRRLCAEILTSAFSGMITFLILINFKLPGLLIAACVGLAGYGSRPVLHILTKKFIAKLNKYSSDVEDIDK